MNDGLIDGFRHNGWSTRILLETCAPLTGEQLDAYVPGTFGSIIDTLWHIVSSEAGYCRWLTDEEPSFDRRSDEPPTIAELTRFNDEMEERWLRFLSVPFDAERTFVMPWDTGENRDVPAGVVLMQAIHHGSEHRSQIATILTQIGIVPPEWGVWEYAAATNRAPVRRA